MPLEIKYKEPVNPITQVELIDGADNRLTLTNKADYIAITASYGDLEITASEFRQWAAAIYKFSQEV